MCSEALNHLPDIKCFIIILCTESITTDISSSDPYVKVTFCAKYSDPFLDGVYCTIYLTEKLILYTHLFV